MRSGSCKRLPKACIARLDADGVVRGKTWRDMPNVTSSNTLYQPLCWWLWKRGLLDLRTAKDEASAARDFEAEEESEVAA